MAQLKHVIKIGDKMNKLMSLILEKHINKFKHNYTKSNKLNINDGTQAWFNDGMYVIYNAADDITTYYTLDGIIILLQNDNKLLLEIISKI